MTWLSNYMTVPVTPGAYGAAVDLGDIRVAVRRGIRPHVHEIMPGMFLVVSLPDPAAMPPAIGAVDLWTGVANAASGVVTKLGDWVAGFFPKAGRAKAETQAAADAVAREQWVMDQEAAAKVARQADRAAARGLDLEMQRLALAEAQAELTQKTIYAKEESESDLAQSMAQLVQLIAAMSGGAQPAAAKTANAIAVSGPHRRRQQAPPGQVLLIRRGGGGRARVAGDGCDCGGTCGGC